MPKSAADLTMRFTEAPVLDRSAFALTRSEAGRAVLFSKHDKPKH